MISMPANYSFSNRSVIITSFTMLINVVSKVEICDQLCHFIIQILFQALEICRRLKEDHEALTKERNRLLEGQEKLTQQLIYYTSKYVS